MLSKYDDLTGEQKIKVTKMYAILSDLRDYLYDFDDKGNYHGRSKVKAAPAKKAEPKPEPKEEAPKRKTTRRTKKK